MFKGHNYAGKRLLNNFWMPLVQYEWLERTCISHMFQTRPFPITKSIADQIYFPPRGWSWIIQVYIKTGSGPIDLPPS